jgi:hypothetical protein
LNKFVALVYPLASLIVIADSKMSSNQVGQQARIMNHRDYDETNSTHT